MEDYADLHIHTSFSDGKQSLEEVIEKAQECHLKAIAITDHDTIDAVKKAEEANSNNGLELISGVELSAIENQKDIHVLGYFVDIHNGTLLKRLREFKDGRYKRAKGIVKNLNKMGVDLKFETVLKEGQNGALGRSHIAHAMVEDELVYTFEEAFAKYIGYDSPAYINKVEITVKEAIDLIHQAEGVAILAHPGTLDSDDRFIEDLIGQGIEGLEVYHPDHNHSKAKRFLGLAQKNNLLVTGGSDSHGVNHKRNNIGSFTIPYDYVKKLREYSRNKERRQQ